MIFYIRAYNYYYYITRSLESMKTFDPFQTGLISPILPDASGYIPNIAKSSFVIVFL